MLGVAVWLSQLLSGSLFVVGTAWQQEASDAQHVQELRAGEIVHRQLTESEVRFKIRLEAGVLLRILIAVEAPTRVVLTDPGGGELHSAAVDADFEVPVSTITRVAGDYAFRLKAAHGHKGGTRYRLSVGQVRPARPDDAIRSAADRLVLKASAPRSGTQPHAVQSALRDLQAARRLYEEVKEREDALGALIRSGQLCYRNDDLVQASQIMQTALAQSRELGNPGLEGSALNAASLVYVFQGRGPEAVAAGRTAVRIARDTRDVWLEARALKGLGDTLLSVGQLNDALQTYLQAAALWRDLHWRRGEAECLLHIGYTYTDLNEEEKALDALTRSEALWRDLGDKVNIAETLRALGGLHSNLDDKQKALDYYLQAHELLPPAGERRRRALLSSAIGWIYFDLGEMAVAARYFRQALDAARSIGYRYAEGGYLHQLGLVSFEMSDYARAGKYYQASLAIFREVGNLRWVALLKLEIGLVLLREGKPEDSLRALNDALVSIPEHAGPYLQARCLEAIGLAHHERADYERAFQAYNEALNVLQAGGYRQGEARTRLQLARLARDRGDLEQARIQFESAMEVIETVRMRIPGPELRASYFSSTHHYFEFYIDLLMRLHDRSRAESYDAIAFQVSERGRARALLDSLTEARVQIRAGVEAGLLERETDLNRRLNRAAARQMALDSNAKVQLEAVAREIQNLTTEYEQVRAAIRTRSPKYAALTQPQPLTLRQVQQDLLDGETVLLEYALGEEHSYLWVVGAQSYETHRLPGRKRIEASVVELRNLLTAHETRPGETTRDRRLRIRDARTRYWEKAAALSEILLGPAAARTSKKRLLIVPDGALQYLPFAALPVPNRSEADGPVPLVVEHELILLPSASALGVLRHETAGRKKADKWLAVLADPVFDAHDSRLAKQQPPLRASQPIQRSGPVSNANTASRNFPRLPSTRMEADSIRAVAPAAGVMTAVGFEANRELATNPELGRYRIVHFATHSIVDYEHPELSGVALSMFDQEGRSRQGLLRLHDIYNLRLPVDLVVLSACQSYLGKQVAGEGLLGIVRGFMYAGATRVIASLWKVDDLATKELMVRFYRNVFGKHESPAAALRNAQVEMWRQPDWDSPYYWAAFVLQGEWRWE